MNRFVDESLDFLNLKTLKIATYKQVKTDKAITWTREGNLIDPIATLADEHGGRAQIIEDDHCYVLLIERDGIYQTSQHLFPEAVDMIKKLQTPKYALMKRVNRIAEELFYKESDNVKAVADRVKQRLKAAGFAYEKILLNPPFEVYVVIGKYLDPKPFAWNQVEKDFAKAIDADRLPHQQISVQLVKSVSDANIMMGRHE